MNVIQTLIEPWDCRSVSCVCVSPSPSMSWSQASPCPLLSVSFWSVLDTVGQLSHESPKESLSEFCWSLLATKRQLSWETEDTGHGTSSCRPGTTRRNSDLHVFDAVSVCILVTLVSDPVVVGVLLTGVRREDTIVLMDRDRPSSSTRWDIERRRLSKTWSADLFAVFVVVHAGQRAVRVSIDVRVHPTRVSISCPAHVTLKTHNSAFYQLYCGEVKLRRPSSPCRTPLRSSPWHSGRGCRRG